MQNVTLKVPADLYDSVSDVFENREERLRDFAFSIALAKVSDYRKREEVYERKYGQDFKKFEKKILEKKGEENFEQWDDYIIWKATHEAHKLWNEKCKKLEKCST